MYNNMSVTFADKPFLSKKIFLEKKNETHGLALFTVCIKRVFSLLLVLCKHWDTKIVLGNIKLHK